MPVALKSNPGLVSLEAIQKWDGKAPQTLVIGDAVVAGEAADLKFFSSLRDVREAIEQEVDDVPVDDAVLG